MKNKKGTPNSVDIHVGKRLRIRRSLLGLSQEKLAEAIGLTFQQVQKYEKGANRISAGRLFEFGRILDVPVDYFFDQMDIKGKKPKIVAPGFADNEQEPFAANDIMDNKETTDLLRAYYSITDPALRRDIMRFIKNMSQKIDNS